MPNYETYPGSNNPNEGLHTYPDHGLSDEAYQAVLDLGWGGDPGLVEELNTPAKPESVHGLLESLELPENISESELIELVDGYVQSGEASESFIVDAKKNGLAE